MVGVPFVLARIESISLTHASHTVRLHLNILHTMVNGWLETACYYIALLPRPSQEALAA